MKVTIFIRLNLEQYIDKKWLQQCSSRTSCASRLALNDFATSFLIKLPIVFARISPFLACFAFGISVSTTTHRSVTFKG